MNDDDELLSLIRASFDDVAPTPPAAIDAARAAFGMRDLDGQLAELIFDSWREDHVAATRSGTAEARLLSFALDDVTLDVEQHADGTTLLGQVSPEGRHVVELETADGVLTDVGADDFGRFRYVAAIGPIRLRVGARLITPWISR